MDAGAESIDGASLRAATGAELAGGFFQTVYDELRQLAGRYLAIERIDHTLQPTALVHEAYLRLSQRVVGSARDAVHLRAIAARAMRVVLIDYARKRKAQKRGAEWDRLTLSTGLLGRGDTSQIDTLELEEALHRLGERDPRLVQIVELRFYGGLTIDEVAAELDISPALVKTDWRLARALLTGFLDGAL